MFNVVGHQSQPLQQQQQQHLTPLNDVTTDRCPAPVSPSTSVSSPLPLLNDGAPRSGDSPSAAAAAAPADGPVSGAVPPAAHRRRAVDASDLRQCALVQTRMKAWKSGYVLCFFRQHYRRFRMSNVLLCYNAMPQFFTPVAFDALWF